MVKLEEVFSEDEEEVESEGEEEEEVLLGFVDEAANPESLERHFFPSKVGGVPAWLDPVRLPQGEATVCGFCGKPLAFLMQVSLHHLVSPSSLGRKMGLGKMQFVYSADLFHIKPLRVLKYRLAMVDLVMHNKHVPYRRRVSPRAPPLPIKLREGDQASFV